MSGLANTGRGVPAGRSRGLANGVGSARRSSWAWTRTYVRRVSGCARSTSHTPRLCTPARSIFGPPAGWRQISRSWTVASGSPFMNVSNAHVVGAVRRPLYTPVAVPT